MGCHQKVKANDACGTTGLRLQLNNPVLPKAPQTGGIDPVGGILMRVLCRTLLA